MPIQFFKQTIAVLVSASDTNGVLGAVEVASPRGSVPPLHVHHREDEAFYVLEGEYSVFIGDDVIKASPGAWVWGPRGVPHGYQIQSDTGRHLSLITPAVSPGVSSFADASECRTFQVGTAPADRTR